MIFVYAREYVQATVWMRVHLRMHANIPTRCVIVLNTNCHVLVLCKSLICTSGSMNMHTCIHVYIYPYIYAHTYNIHIRHPPNLTWWHCQQIMHGLAWTEATLAACCAQWRALMCVCVCVRARACACFLCVLLHACVCECDVHTCMHRNIRTGMFTNNGSYILCHFSQHKCVYALFYQGCFSFFLWCPNED